MCLAISLAVGWGLFIRVVVISLFRLRLDDLALCAIGGAQFGKGNASGAFKGISRAGLESDVLLICASKDCK